MGVPTVRPPRIRDYDDQYQRDTKNAITGLDAPGSRKVTVRGVALTAGAVIRVPHQLGKIPVGWLVTDKNAQADVWRDPTFTPTNDLFGLRASATVTVDLQFW